MSPFRAVAATTGRAGGDSMAFDAAALAFAALIFAHRKQAPTARTMRTEIQTNHFVEEERFVSALDAAI